MPIKKMGLEYEIIFNVLVEEKIHSLNSKPITYHLRTSVESPHRTSGLFNQFNSLKGLAEQIFWEVHNRGDMVNYRVTSESDEQYKIGLVGRTASKDSTTVIRRLFYKEFSKIGKIVFNEISKAEKQIAI